MITLDLVQGSPEWLKKRGACFNASDAPAMMGVSKYKTRSALIREKATGITPDIDAATQARFDEGHAAEASIRPHVESLIGDELYPVVATTDCGRFLASSDGATLDNRTGFEHKLWNEDLAGQVRNGRVPDSHAWQLDHQCLVFGFERIIFVVSDGTTDKVVSCEYKTTDGRQIMLLAGWEQFAKDVAAWVPEPEADPAPVGRAPETLPALRIEVTGSVTASNLPEFKGHALAVFEGIKTELKTDEDFADAEKTVKWCKEVEDKLDAAKQHALSQTASIDELFRVIDEIKETARQKRMKLDKLVKAEKESRKLEIVSAANNELSKHIDSLTCRLGVRVKVDSYHAFADAVHGLKSLESMRDKVATKLAHLKIEADSTAGLIDTNRAMVDDMTLVPDFEHICTKAPDDFAALLAVRKQQRKEAEERQAEPVSAPNITDSKAPAAIEGSTVSLGQINALLSPVKIDAAGLATLGINPSGKKGAAVLFLESDVSRICSALISHISKISGHRKAA